MRSPAVFSQFAATITAIAVSVAEPTVNTLADC